MKGDDGIDVPADVFEARVASIAQLAVEIVAAQIGAVAACEDLDRRYTRAIFLHLCAMYLIGSDSIARTEFLEDLGKLREAAEKDEAAMEAAR